MTRDSRAPLNDALQHPRLLALLRRGLRPATWGCRAARRTSCSWSRATSSTPAGTGASWACSCLSTQHRLASLGDCASARRRGTREAPKRWVAMSVALNLLFLGFFKYFNFFVDSANALLRPHGRVPPQTSAWTSSCRSASRFYTFQSISYIVDVYRGEIEPARNPSTSRSSWLFFPHMVAGPIMRSQRARCPRCSRPATHALERGRRPGFTCADAGGSSRRSVIADNLAAARRRGLRARSASIAPASCTGRTSPSPSRSTATSPATPTSPGAIAQLHGLRACMDNFNAPVLSPPASPTSGGAGTSACPRGSATTSTSRSAATAAARCATYRNLMLTMVLGGLWHGAAWNVRDLGRLPGRPAGPRAGSSAAARLIARLGRAPGRWGSRALWAVRVLVTFHFVCLGWVIFRCEDIGSLGSAGPTLHGRPSAGTGCPSPRSRARCAYIAPVLAMDARPVLPAGASRSILEPPLLRRGRALYALGFYAFLALRTLRVERLHLLPVLTHSVEAHPEPKRR